MPELVYILTNPTMPDLVKIGQTTDIEKRLKDLSSHSGIPVPFECYYCCEVENSCNVEKLFHFGLGDRRINPKREFFRISPERAKALLECVAISDATPNKDIVESEEEQVALDRERARRPVFTFSMVDIPIGSELTFREDKTLTATVKEDRKIDYQGEVASLSRITSDILKKQFGKNWESCRGPDYWIFENETLTERRLRLETSE